MVKIEFRQVRKELVKDLIQISVIELSSRKDFDMELRERKKDNYVLEFKAVI